MAPILSAAGFLRVKMRFRTERRRVMWISYIIYGIIFFGFPVGGTLWGWYDLRKHPENRAKIPKGGADSWGPF